MKKLLLSAIAVFSLLLVVTNSAHAQFGTSSQTFDANGTFTVPAGITSITVEMWGGGGHSPSNIVGAGGGAYVRSFPLSVSPGQQFTVHVARWVTPQNTVFINGDFGGLIFVNSSTSQLGAAANTVGGLTAASFSGGDGGSGYNFSPFGIFYGGGGAAAGRNGNGAPGCDGLSPFPGCGNGIDGGGSGGSSGQGIQGTIPGGGCSGNTFMTSGGVQGRCIVWWSCPSSAGSIGNTHTVPFPEESTSDIITSLTPANGNGNAVTYSWQQSSDNINWTTATGSTNSTTYSVPNISSNTYYRRTINSCGSGNSNSVLIKVFSQGNGLKNGTISGRVTSLNGTGVAGITISAQKTVSLLGSPQSYIYTATTDNNGYYEIQNIFYGDLTNGDPSSVTFTATASKLNHIFSAPLTPSLSNTNPVRINQNFTDSTVYAITGKTYQECTTCVDVNGVSQPLVTAPLDSVLMNKNGSFFAKSGYVTPPGEYGRWSTTVQDPGNYTISPSFNGHTFLPASTTLNVTGNVANVNFNDTTTHVISGYLRAGCNDYIGTTVLEFADVLPNDVNGQPRPSVFRKRVITNSLTGFYTVRLPARKYKVRVISFSPSITNTTNPDYIYEADLLAFFNTNYGGTTNVTALPYSALERDVTTHDTILNLTYQRPPSITLFGLVDSCINLSDPSLTYSVWKQAEKKAIGFKVYQGSPAKGCPLTADTLRLATNVHVDDVNKDTLIAVVNDSAKISLTGGVPNIIAPYYKVFNAQYHDQYGRYANRDIYNNTGIAKNIVVTGVKSDNGFFTTVSPELPMMVLHDPPGDLSSSTWSSSQTNESALRWNVAAGVGYESFLKVKLGTKLITGLGVAIESEVWGSVQGGLNVSSRFNGGEESIVTTTATQTISTSADEDVTGASGDLFMGGAVNLLYAIAHEIKYSGCNVTNTKRLMIAQDGFATTYYYTDDAIRNSVIPTLIQFKNNPGNTAAQTANYANQISVWQQVLGNNEMNKARAAFDRNVSFFGSAGPVSFSSTTSSSKTSSFDFNLEIENSIATELGLEIGGSGITGGTTVKFKMETGVSTNNTTTTSTTVGYTLDDNEANDNFSVNIKKDPVYNTPVFETVAGQSSCPPEAGTYLRDAMQLIIPVPMVSGVTPNGDAIFTMLLGNLSADAAPRTYNLTFDQSSNPFGASILIGGSPVVGGVPTPYTIASGGQTTVTVVVRKNTSSNIYSYEGLTFTLSDACDGSITKSGTISAYFNSPCSNITLVTPADNWINRITDNNNIDVAFNGYTVANLQSVTLEYSADGTSNWNTGFIRQQNQINNSVNGTTVNWDVSNIPDGKYNLRLKLNCATGIIYSQRVTGIIDRKAPGLFGKPEPTDNNYIAGDPVSFSYDENIDNTNLNSNKVIMTLLSNNSNIPVSVSGFANKIAISPSVSLLSYTGDSVRVIAKNIADIYGNVKTAADTFYFTIGTFTPSTGPNAANVIVNYSPMFENANSMMDIVFTLNSPAANNLRINYTISGTAIYNNDYSVDSLAATRIHGVQGYVIIPQNSTQTIVKIDPVGDNAPEQDETVIISIAEGGDYSLGSNYAATAVILSEEIPADITADGPLDMCNGSTVTLSVPGGSNNGNALNLDGVNDYVQDNSVVVNPVSGFTVEGWMNIKDINSYNGLAARTLSNIPAPFDIYTEAGTGKIKFFVGDGNNFGYATSNTSLAVGIWAHVACVYDPSSEKIIIYINGVEDGSADVSGISIAGTGTTFRMGSRSDFDYFSDIQIDEVRVWNVARTAEQIKSTANTAVLNNSAGLTAYYKFDEANGTITANSVTGLNTGSLVNGTGRLKPTTAPFTSNIYVWNNGAQGNNLVVDSPGSYSVNITTAYGVTASSNPVVVTEKPFSGSDVYETACDNFEWNGTTYFESGTYIYNYALPSGCDSVVTLHLTINTTPMVVLNTFGDFPLEFCAGGKAAWIAYSPDVTLNYSWSASPPVPLDVTSYQFGTNERCDADITQTTVFTVTGDNGVCPVSVSKTVVVIPATPISIVAGSIVCDNDSAVLSVAIPSQENSRFATTVIDKSSEYGTAGNSWSAEKALGAPDVYPLYGDIGSSWASLMGDDAREYIVLGYDNADPVNYIDIYETFNPGAVDTVYVKNPNTGEFEVVYSADALVEPPVSSVLHITFAETSYPVNEIRIAMNSAAVPDWNEIDAVGIGLSDIYSYQWSTSETTSQIHVAEGEYSVKVIADGLCYQGSTTVSNNSLVSIIAEGSTSICPGDSVVLTAQSNVFSGSALQFDGSGKYIEEDITALPQGNASRTMECWIKTDQSYAGVIANWGNITTNERFGLIVIGGTLYFVGENNDYQGSISVSDDQWHHVAVTYDGTDLFIYVDGVLDISASTSLNTTGTILRIGQRAVPETGEYFAGTVDELRIWNTARTALELNSDKDHSVAANSAGLVSYFKMDEGSNEVTKDEVSNNDVSIQDGTASWTNGAVFSGTYIWAPGGQATSSITVYDEGTYTLILNGPGGCTITGQPVSVTTNTNCNASAALDLHLLIQGYCIGGGMMNSPLFYSGMSFNDQDCDSITVKLFSQEDLYTPVATVTSVMNIYGWSHLELPQQVNGGTYYIAVSHRNALQTWSSLPVTLGTITNYDFTSLISKAYTDGFGNNAMVEVEPDQWALWSGDIAGFDGTPDEYVDLFDAIYLDNDISTFVYGYVSTDLNGDGFVDLFDQIILDNNMSLFLYSQHPVAP